MRELLFLTILVKTMTFELNTDCKASSSGVFPYYDTSIMQYTSCGSNKVGSDDCSSCICAPGYAKSSDTRDFPSFTCSLCSGSVPSSDQYTCQNCPSGSDSSKKECICTWNNFEVIIEKDLQGNYLDTKECVACDSSAYYTGDFSYQCSACSDGNMERDANTHECSCKTGYVESQGTCVASSEISQLQISESAYTMIYNNRENAQGVGSHTLSPSYTFRYFYQKAALDCYVYNVIKGCQILANLCVLQLYNEDAEVCKVYKSQAATRDLANQNVQDQGWKKDMAWIYYERSAKTILEAGTVTMKVTFDSSDSTKVNLMEFKLAEFSIDGTLLGFQELTDQLILCPHSLEDSKNYREFGTNINIACSLDLTQFFNMKKNSFYEMYFIDESDNIIDVPILVTNYMVSGGNTPNSETKSKSGWKLTRRFFIYDNLSGISTEGGYETGARPEIVQYLNRAKLVFTLRSDKEQQIYVPYLVLTYKSRLYTYVDTTDSTDSVKFISEYGMDTSKFWKIAEGIFIGINILIFIAWIVRLYVWTKINPQKDSPTTYTRWIILTSIRLLITTWGFLMFWYLFGLTGYWFIFYKLQYHVYALIPPLSTFSENYYAFEVVLGLTISCCIFNAFYQIFHQANLDLLLIDWEKPNRDPLSKNKEELAEMQRQGLHPVEIDNIIKQREESVYKEYVSAWRYLFIVNELNELQSQRYVSIEFSLIFFVFLLDGLGWDELSRAQPNVDVGHLEGNTSPKNPVLRYFLTCSLLLIIMYLQFVVRKVISNLKATPVQNFIDLCSIANISVMVLDEYLHGYYIHGVSPNGSAETGLDELLENLMKEASGKSRARGILPEDKTGLQSYEIFIPTAIRKTYNNLAKQPVETGLIEYRQGLREASGLPTVPEALPANMNIERAQEIRQELNRRLKIYIAGLVRDARTQILDKSPWQRFLRMPPVDLSLLDGTPYFYRDPSIGFESSFLMGREFSFLLMDIMLFELFDYNIGITYVAILLTYVVSKIVSKVRAMAGEWNLSRKALVNKRFLL